MTKRGDVGEYSPGPDARSARATVRRIRNEGRKAAIRASERREDPMIAAGKETIKAQQRGMRETATQEGGYTK